MKATGVVMGTHHSARAFWDVNAGVLLGPIGARLRRPMVEIDWPRLFEVAAAARLRAHAPYSRFQVGAALLADDGTVHAGCNLENASYGLTVCAERNAAAALVLAGRSLRAVAIVAGTTAVTPPCGACRQVLAELGGPDLPVRSRTPAGAEAGWTLGQLLPSAFTRHAL
jgi:cytidine deaminase